MKPVNFVFKLESQHQVTLLCICEYPKLPPPKKKNLNSETVSVFQIIISEKRYPDYTKLHFLQTSLPVTLVYFWSQIPYRKMPPPEPTAGEAVIDNHLYLQRSFQTSGILTLWLITQPSCVTQVNCPKALVSTQKKWTVVGEVIWRCTQSEVFGDLINSHCKLSDKQILL